jgi:hypothetical protein
MPPVLRRKRLPASLEAPHDAFLAVLSDVEGAKEALVDVMPRSRAPGRPLADGLLEFEEMLQRAAAAMPGWRAEGLDTEWEACVLGIDRARRLAERLRLAAPELGFDALAFTVQDLIAPLEAFAEAAERFRALRRRR